MNNVYLDHSATTAVRPEVLEAMWPYFAEAFGNPSSVHSGGGLPREAVERARSGVAGVLGCRPAEVVFTASGTEADNLALIGAARALRQRGNHVITTQIEHHAVLHSVRQLEHEGFRVTYLGVDGDGLVDLERLAAAIGPDTILLSVMLANNEVGTIEPLPEIAALAHERGVAVHTDAVQAAATLELDVDRLGVDLLSVSAHKFYGPKGVGALYVRRDTQLEPIVHGGDQERGFRSGTENVPGIVGLAVALMLAQADRTVEAERLSSLRDRLIDGTLSRVPGAHLTGHRTRRLPGHASFYLDGVSGESVLVNLDVAGIACSSGSACKAGSTDPSHVLTAVGMPPQLARNALRMSLGRETTEEDIDYVLEVFPRVVEDLTQGSRLTAQS
jgi:cysteine desulfurase